MRIQHMTRYAGLLALSFGAILTGPATAAEGENAVERLYQAAPAAPRPQSWEQADARSVGCVSCHTPMDAKTMHQQPGVILGCADCHGGDAAVTRPAGLAAGSDGYQALLTQAHVLPRYPETWNWPSSANPPHSYTLLNREAPEFIRFVNPGDYRVAREACGACHLPTIEAAERSLMATTAMFWEGAAYNNGILPYKRPILGEAYTRDGEAGVITNPLRVTVEMEAKGIIEELWPLPSWETTPAADVFRIFERGGRVILNLFPETGLPNVEANIQRLDEPGRPDVRQSVRGAGTGNRIAVPVLNLHKTRLNDPLMWFLGTNDQPGDYRSSGCSSCHVVYANDRQPKHSGVFAPYGHTGASATRDPTIPRDEPGHPIAHSFSSAIPTSQCMSCHMHQPNIFVNSFLGYTMWDYEADAPAMWPKEQRYPSDEEIREINRRNPEGAAVRGLWGDADFLRDVSALNPQLNNTQFADYHGHGWVFRAVYKKDRQGNLLDAQGGIVAHDDPDKFDKAVHMSSIHADAGMHCVDCHYSQDVHGDGHIYGEVAQAIEIECADCHGTAKQYPPLLTSGPAAPQGGTDMLSMRTPDGRRRFEWVGDSLYQRSNMDPNLEWKLSLVKDSVSPGHSEYNAKAARAKLMSKDTATQDWGSQVATADLAHADEEIMCTSCHTSWTTSCGGCHLPIEANWKSERQHYEGGITRNFATYNPQVVRDQIFQLGRHGPSKGNRIAPVRSSSALVLSSTDAQRQRIYVQQPPIAASGFSSQAFAPHFAHTVRKEETKACGDCHLSVANDNNAIMSQLLLQGTDFVDFLGFNAWLGLDGAIAAVEVTEWEEPQAVIGSYLHRYAYPDDYAAHQTAERQLETMRQHRTGDAVGCLQLRGEYLFAAQGRGGFEVFDVANVANKGFSQRLLTAPFSPLGHDTRVSSKDASCVALPTNQPIDPKRNQGELMRVTNQEQAFHPIYNYAFVSDRQEGLIVVDVTTLGDGEARNNKLRRALTWNPGGLLKGARHITVAGHYAYVAAAAGLVVLDIDDPLKPRQITTLPLAGVRSTEVQFRYLFATTDTGLEVVDITSPARIRIVPGASVPIQDARGLFVSRTYAYVAAGRDGLAIIDVTRPEAPRLATLFNAAGRIQDATDVVIASTNASLFAYVADGTNGLQLIQLTSPETVPGFYGFSPVPQPQWIASRATGKPALALSKGLERDRAVDETGEQIAVFGRIGSRPFNREEMERLYLDKAGAPWFVRD